MPATATERGAAAPPPGGPAPRLKLRLATAGEAEDDLRRWSPPPGGLTFAALDAKLRALFGLGPGVALRVTYCDEDGDQVTLGGESDMDELLAQNLSTVRVTITRKPKPVKKEVKKEDRKEDKKEPSKKEEPKDAAAGVEEPKKKPAGTKGPQKKHGEARGKHRAAWLDKCIAKLLENMEAWETSGERWRLEKMLRILGKSKRKLAGAADEVALVEFLASVMPNHYQCLVSLQLKAHQEPMQHAHAMAVLQQAMGSQDKPEPDAGPAEHVGITCDGCQQHPIFGTRFKSLNRPDFDVCQDCHDLVQENKDTMDSKAVDWANDDFLRIERPCHWRLEQLEPETEAYLFGAPHHIPHGRHHHPPHGFPPHAGYGFGPGFGGPGRGCWRRGGGRGGGGRFGPRGCPFPGPGGGPMGPFGRPAPAGEALQARFVRDVALADNCQVSPGEAGLIKIWRLRNSGQAPWPEGCTLLWVGGDTLGCVASTLLEIPAGGLPPGHELDVAVEVRAPEEPGRYQAYFRLKAPGPFGQRFGQRVWCQLVVAPAPMAAPPTGEQDPASAPPLLPISRPHTPKREAQPPAQKMACPPSEGQPPQFADAEKFKADLDKANKEVAAGLTQFMTNFLYTEQPQAGSQEPSSDGDKEEEEEEEEEVQYEEFKEVDEESPPLEDCPPVDPVPPTQDASVPTAPPLEGLVPPSVGESSQPAAQHPATVPRLSAADAEALLQGLPVSEDYSEEWDRLADELKEMRGSKGPVA